jgi:hypothetical protein
MCPLQRSLPGIARKGQSVGERATTSGKPQHCHCPSRQQGKAYRHVQRPLLTYKLDLADAASTEQVAAVEAEAETGDDDGEESSTPAGPAGDDVRQVSRSEAETYAKECGLLFFEASAKTGANVGEVFTEIGKQSFGTFL